MPAGLTRRIFLGLAAAALLLAGCGDDYAADIEAVKQAETAPGTANGKLVDGKPQDLLAGALNLMLLQLQ